MKIQCSYIMFDNIHLYSSVELTTADGILRSLHTKQLYIHGAKSESTLKPRQRGMLTYEYESREGEKAGSHNYADVEFQERDEEGRLIFFVTKTTSETVCI